MFNAVLGRVNQLECHGDPGGLGAGPPGDLGPVPDRGEGRLDGVGREQVDPYSAG